MQRDITKFICEEYLDLVTISNLVKVSKNFHFKPTLKIRYKSGIENSIKRGDIEVLKMHESSSLNTWSYLYLAMLHKHHHIISYLVNICKINKNYICYTKIGRDFDVESAKIYIDLLLKGLPTLYVTILMK